ncbi:MAG: magnesium transporter CorA family protein [Dehalococcoidia bacterium]|nr:magnesium transporter CorA family protein [Dehalococcoidia bacterium]
MEQAKNSAPVDLTGLPPETIVQGTGLAWMNLEKPTRPQLEKLAELYGFHSLDIDDCLSRLQLPKVDEYNEYLFIIMHFPVFNKKTRIISPSQVAIFYAKNFLITIHTGDLKCLSNLFKECKDDDETRKECLDNDAGYLCYRIVDVLVDDRFPMLNKVLQKLDTVEDQVFDENIDAVHEVAILRRDISGQRRIIWAMRTLMVDLEHRAQRFTDTDLKVYFGDINDHLKRIWGTLEEARDRVEIYKDADFILSQDRLQKIMAILTVITATMLPFALISSIYGMNVPLPGTGVQDTHVVGWILLGIMTAIAAALLYIFRRHRWF